MLAIYKNYDTYRMESTFCRWAAGTLLKLFEFLGDVQPIHYLFIYRIMLVFEIECYL